MGYGNVAMSTVRTQRAAPAVEDRVAQPAAGAADRVEPGARAAHRPRGVELGQRGPRSGGSEALIVGDATTPWIVTDVTGYLRPGLW